jgi:hypothetical protein
VDRELELDAVRALDEIHHLLQVLVRQRGGSNHARPLDLVHDNPDRRQPGTVRKGRRRPMGMIREMFASEPLRARKVIVPAREAAPALR